MGYYAGIDVGSLSTDAVVIDDSGKILGWSVVATGARGAQAAQKSLAEALALAEINEGDIIRTISTGYGRKIVSGSDKSITEITCHARGAIELFPNTRTVIDIGGQDSKAIRIADNGKVQDFAMNDKCAAGTGRFLEVMARVLEMDLDDLGSRALKSTEEISISSMCTVFAESEVISLLSQEKKVEDVAWGLCRSVVGRVWAMAQRVGPTPELTMTGGVAKNAGVVAAMKKVWGKEVDVPPEPQIVGALGAALIARDGG